LKEIAEHQSAKEKTPLISIAPDQWRRKGKGQVQWRGTIFGQEGQDRERQNWEHEIKVFAGIGAFFFVRKTSVLQIRKKVFAVFGAFFDPKSSVLLKTKVLAGFGAFSCPKYGSGYRSQGGGLNISRMGQLAPYFPRLWASRGASTYFAIN